MARDVRTRRAPAAEGRALARTVLGAGALSLATAAVPFSPTAPTGMAAALGVVGLALGALLHARAARLPRALPHAVLLLATSVVTVSVLASTTPAGRVVTACSYVWIALFTAAFHSRRAVCAHLVLLLAGFAAALWGGGAPSPAQTWGFMGGTVAAVAWTVNGLVLRLRARADEDQLTGALTRAAWLAEAEAAAAHGTRDGAPASLVVLDLDGFKEVNDRDGHAAGDRLLADLARAWAGTLRPGDLLGRLGGDEFALLLPRTRAAQVPEVLAALRAARPQGRWSAGTAEHAPGEAVADWLERADADLYAHKRARPGASRPAARRGPRPEPARGP
ncbi:GGDEF domain-containing protein [Paenibacillus sp. TRM 82003]|uniref:GGDEF domain-containing protein n=1 Tax=Kineococcus sp. TRM81007 TaxID=2925831 RepID=UPI001F5A211D|nr:GGDEF domain-containing protein [Kineococcus sp. TRM81007]MCI2239784.1 GGDEF domain-containing protein [Kineococcus sp. TRM81007]MCI3925912.1 GGDEF domain-containing protein [Paenibacillus sp. TRM 82003]